MPLEKLTERLRKLMQEKGKDISQVTRETGIDPDRMKRYLAGDAAKMTHEEICILSDYFDVLPAYLMGWIDHRKIKYVFHGGHKEYTFRNVHKEEATQKVLNLMIKEGILTIEETD